MFSLKSYYNFWVEFVGYFCIRTYFPLPCVYLFLKKRKKKEEVMFPLIIL